MSEEDDDEEVDPFGDPNGTCVALQVKNPEEMEPATDSRALTQEEYDRLIAVCPNWLAAVIAWACHTGMDKGMILGLRWGDLALRREGKNIVSGSVKFLRSKTGKPVRQVLSAPALAALNQARQARHASGVVFLDAKSQAIEGKALDWALGKALKAAGLQGFNFRSFRHTFATWALRSGVRKSADDYFASGISQRCGSCHSFAAKNSVGKLFYST